MATEETNIITQKEGERFALDHRGAVALYGEKEKNALQHEFAGQIVHTTVKPLVHLLMWGEEKPCEVEVTGRVTLAGDKEAPVEVRMTHHFDNEHQQRLKVEPLDHHLKVQTQLSEPIHHALQLRTPVQMRFANPWHLASDYRVEIKLGNTQFMSISLTGATIATPQPVADEIPCPKPPGNITP